MLTSKILLFVILFFIIDSFNENYLWHCKGRIWKMSSSFSINIERFSLSVDYTLRLDKVHFDTAIVTARYYIGAPASRPDLLRSRSDKACKITKILCWLISLIIYILVQFSICRNLIEDIKLYLNPLSTSLIEIT